MTNGLTLYAGINNLFDKEYYHAKAGVTKDTSGNVTGDKINYYAGTKRNYFVGFKYNF